MIALGFRLDWLASEALSWRDLLVIVRQAPPGSAVARAIEPERSEWGLSEQLLALVADYLAWIQWSKTEDGEKNRRRPKPIPRPGVEPEVEQRRIGTDPVSIAEMEKFLNWSFDKVTEVKNPRPRDARGRFVKRQ